MSDTAKTVLVAVLLALGFLLLVGSCVRDEDRRDAHRAEFNSWLSECIGQEGTPTLTHVQSNGADWYECMVDGKEVQIP